MNLSAGWIIASFFVSTVGLGLFLYGKKQVRIPQLAAGIVLMVFPGFVASPAWILGIAGALVGGLWITVRAGA
jgi:cytochrome bd-type quinol oxidase subunit 1